MSAADISAPLDGLRVLEVAEGAAGAWAGRALADLGADVIKVEGPDGSPMRSTPERFAVFHAGKRSTQIDAATDAELVAGLVGEANCLLVDSESAVAPDVIALLGSWRGIAVLFDHEVDPASKAPGCTFHRTGQSVLDGTGKMPVAPPGDIPAHDVAMTAVFAVLAAIRNSPFGDRDGALVVRVRTDDVELGHGRLDLTRAANEHVARQHDPFLALLLRCRDGEVSAHVNRTYWTTWCRLIGRPDLDADAALATMQDLHAQRERVIAAIEEWTLCRSADDVEAQGQAAGLPVGAVLTPDQVAQDRQLVHRAFIGECGLPAMLPLALADGRRWNARGAAPAPGDTAAGHSSASLTGGAR